MKTTEANTIVLATSNLGKLKELEQQLAHLNIHWVAQTAFNVPDADETGKSFVENAILKARHAAALTQKPALADDSELTVDALDGAPGIYSKRYAGEQANDMQRINKLLSAIAHIKAPHRSAQCQCVLALVREAQDPNPIIAHGIWPGSMTLQPQDVHGFGYDPIF